MSLLRRLALDITPLRTSRDFRLVFSAAGVSGFGSMLTYVTIPFQIAEITDDPLLVGLIGVCELVPLVVMAFVGGALADYLDRRLLVLGPRRPRWCSPASCCSTRCRTGQRSGRCTSSRR